MHDRHCPNGRGSAVPKTPAGSGRFLLLQPDDTFGIASGSFAQKQRIDNVEKSVYIELTITTFALFFAIQSMCNQIGYLNKVRVLRLADDRILDHAKYGIMIVSLVHTGHGIVHSHPSQDTAYLHFIGLISKDEPYRCVPLLSQERVEALYQEGP